MKGLSRFESPSPVAERGGVRDEQGLGELKIQRAFGFFQSPAGYAVGIDHRGSYIAVAQKCLDSADIIIACKR